MIHEILFLKGVFFEYVYSVGTQSMKVSRRVFMGMHAFSERCQEQTSAFGF